MKYRWLAILCVVMFVTAAPAQVYYWTDENGVKHYSNVKPAEEVDFEEKKEEGDGSGTPPEQTPSTQPSARPKKPVPQKPPRVQPQQQSPKPAGARTDSPPQESRSPEAEKEEGIEDVVLGARLNIQKFPIPQDQLIAEETARLQRLKIKFDQMGISREARIEAESARLIQAISDLEAAPLPKFGSQDNKRRQVGYYKYRLQDLTNAPDQYFEGPAE